MRQIETIVKKSTNFPAAVIGKDHAVRRRINTNIVRYSASMISSGPADLGDRARHCARQRLQSAAVWQDDGIMGEKYLFPISAVPPE